MERKLSDDSNKRERNEETESPNEREKKSLTQRRGVYGLFVGLITHGQLRSTVLDPWATLCGDKSVK